MHGSILIALPTHSLSTYMDTHAHTAHTHTPNGVITHLSHDNRTFPSEPVGLLVTNLITHVNRGKQFPRPS